MSKPQPRFIPPMMAQLADELPIGKEWRYEVKLDGIRAIAVKNGRDVKLFSRRPRDMTENFPEIVSVLRRLRQRQLVLDGEIIALDEEGRSSFQLLQNLKREETPVFYVLFDLLHANGVDLLPQPWEARRQLLEKILPSHQPPLRLSPLLEGSARKIWSGVKRLKLEGIIAKQRNSPYASNRRTASWQKIKAQNEQEFVIGGYTEPRGSRHFFGAILVGYYEAKRLLFASAVGTGFDTATLRTLHQKFQSYRIPDCPFTNLPIARKNRYGGGLTRAEMKRCTWLRPELVCQVRFYEWTRDANLRQPVFLGLREDKRASDVRRELPAGAS